MPELLPCPFCESVDVEAKWWAGESHVECGNCEMRGPTKAKEENALAAWNALPRSAGQLVALEEAYEAIDSALAIIPANRPPKSDSERFCNLLRGLLTIERHPT